MKMYMYNKLHNHVIVDVCMCVFSSDFNEKGEWVRVTTLKRECSEMKNIHRCIHLNKLLFTKHMRGILLKDIIIHIALRRFYITFHPLCELATPSNFNVAIKLKHHSKRFHLETRQIRCQLTTSSRPNIRFDHRMSSPRFHALSRQSLRKSRGQLVTEEALSLPTLPPLGMEGEKRKSTHIFITALSQPISSIMLKQTHVVTKQKTRGSHKVIACIPWKKQKFQRDQVASYECEAMRAISRGNTA